MCHEAPNRAKRIYSVNTIQSLWTLTFACGSKCKGYFRLPGISVEIQLQAERENAANGPGKKEEYNCRKKATRQSISQSKGRGLSWSWLVLSSCDKVEGRRANMNNPTTTVSAQSQSDTTDLEEFGPRKLRRRTLPSLSRRRRTPYERNTTQSRSLAEISRQRIYYYCTRTATGQ